MTQVAFSSSFKRAFKKRIEGRKELEQKFWRRVEIFTANPYDPRLRTHKLSGELRQQWSFTVEYDIPPVIGLMEVTDNGLAAPADVNKTETTLCCDARSLPTLSWKSAGPRVVLDTTEFFRQPLASTTGFGLQV